MTPEVRAIREAEYEACLDLWRTVWPGDNRGYFRRYFFGDQDFQNDYCRVCNVDGKIVSAAHIVKRVVSCGDFTLTMGGIGNVATLPEYRGRGYNTACLRQAVAVMEADAMDFSLLFTGIPDYYARLGWEWIEGRSVAGRIRSTRERRYSRITVRRYEERDDAALHLIYAATNRNRPIAVRRSAPYWRDWIRWWRGSVPGEARVAEEEGAVVGYGFHRVRRGEAIVAEIGVREGAEAAVDALLEQVAVESLAEGVSRMRLRLPDCPGIRGATERILTEIDRPPDSTGMMRLLSRDNLLRGLTPELTDRWLRAGRPPGSLNFRTPYGPARIESTGDFLRVEPADDGELSQADFFTLLIGRGIPEGNLDRRSAAFAAALFPPFDAWYWDLDGF